jgi:hypothetical protein
MSRKEGPSEKSLFRTKRPLPGTQWIEREGVLKMA